MSRRRSVTNHSDATFSRFTATFIESAFDYKRIMTPETYEIIKDIADAKSSPFASLFISIIANYIAAKSKAKIQMTARTDRWTMNLNTYSIFIGPQCSGKTPTIKAAIMEPFKELGTDLRNSIKGRMTMAALADELADREKGHNVYMVNSEVAETLCRHVDSSKSKSNGDLALLNQVYSGEDVDNGYTTRNDQHIPGDAALCILGMAYHVYFITKMIFRFLKEYL